MGLVYCRRCRGLASDKARCPNCGSTDPGGLSSAASGAFVFGTLIAVAVTGAYAYVLSLVWEKWLDHFSRLPSDHPFADYASETAYGIGLAVFLVAWVASVWVLFRCAFPPRPPRAPLCLRRPRSVAVAAMFGDDRSVKLNTSSVEDQTISDTSLDLGDPARMKAICFSRYGAPDVLGLRTLESPTPRNDEVLVRIHATTVTPGDCETRRFDFPWWVWAPLRLYLGVFRPRRPVLGMEFSGVVTAVGKNVTRFKVGDAVFASTGLPFGTYAEYRCQPAASAMVVKPDGVSHAEAATISVGGANALHYLRKGKVRPGDKVLINGAAGCFGTYAVQLAKHLGAEVTGVDSTDKLSILRDLGADHVIDYTQHDFTATGVRYDVILEIAGKASYSRCLRSLNRNGRLVLANPRFWQMLRAPLTSLFTSKKVSFAFYGGRAEDLEYLAGLMAAGTLKAVIDRRYPLDSVAEGHRYVESGVKIGHVVIEVRAEPKHGRLSGEVALPDWPPQELRLSRRVCRVV